MVLSGSIAFGDVLPAWMFHAQVPPPDHQFDPSLPGITWVDLVFPFFLFSMGAAIPLSLKKYIDQQKNFLFISVFAIKRFCLLVFFALFTQHMKAWVLSDSPGWREHLLSLLAFALLFLQFYENKHQQRRTLWSVLKLLSFLAAAGLLWLLPFNSGKGFDFHKSDIIILVLANMAFFGTIIYYLTYNRPLLRLGLLPFVMAVFFAAQEPGDNWAKSLYVFDQAGPLSIDWLYQFYFLKYLFIIIPGTFAGEWLLQQKQVVTENKTTTPVVAAVAFLLVPVNLYGLFTRHLVTNLVFSFTLCAVGCYLVQQSSAFYKKLVQAGSYLLLLGLFFEPYEGGIKKDPSTYSYYFVTSGLAFFTLLGFSLIANVKMFSSLIRFVSSCGQQPMVAYVAGSLVVLPLLHLTGTYNWWNSLHQNSFTGLLKGVLFTGIVSLITLLFVRRKWFWKT